MKIDVTLKITPEMVQKSISNGNDVMGGHIGTHFDVMDKDFPLEYTRLPGVIFDVRGINERPISPSDIDLSKISEGMAVLFFSGFIYNPGFEDPRYSKEHPYLSDELLDALINKKICIIGLDFAGIKRGAEHPPKDQYCSDHGVFVVENMTGLDEIIKLNRKFDLNTYPMNLTGVTGLPCRVIVTTDSC